MASVTAAAAAASWTGETGSVVSWVGWVLVVTAMVWLGGAVLLPAVTPASG